MRITTRRGVAWTLLILAFLAVAAGSTLDARAAGTGQGSDARLLTQSASQPVTVTLSTDTIDSVIDPFTITIDSGQPLIGLTASRLALTNAKISKWNPITTQIPIAGGATHSLAVRSDGTVACWGYNSHPIPDGVNGGAIAVTAGLTHSLMLEADGSIVIIGAFEMDDHYSQPFDTTQVYYSAAPDTPLSGIVAIASGSNHAMALGRDGTVYWWGNTNYYHEPEVGDDLSARHDGVAISARGDFDIVLWADGTVSVQGGYKTLTFNYKPAGLNNVIGVAAGTGHFLALKNDGTVTAWGSNASGQLNVPGNLNNAVAVAAGNGFSMALRANGTVAIWGTMDPPPQGLTDVVAIAAGDNHCLAMRADGSVVCWGQNSDGQCSVPSGLVANKPAFTHGQFQITPLQLGPLTVQIPAGAATSALGGIPNQASNLITRNFAIPGGLSVTLQPAAAVAAGGKWRRAGTTPWLNSGASEPRLAPGSYKLELLDIGLNGWQRPTSLDAVVAPGANTALTATYTAMPSSPVNVTLSSLAPDPVIGPFPVTAAFSAPVWGMTTASLALTNASVSNLRPLTPVPSISASVSGYFSLAITGNGSVVAWGDNHDQESVVPAGVDKVIAVSAGYKSALALKSDGTVMAWGSNAYGQCNIPAGLKDVVAVSGGSEHSLALKSNGTVVAWGSNDVGQCNIPAGLSGVVAISAGDLYNLALRADGTVVGWGDDDYGQCSVPYGLNDIVAISAGPYNALALRSDGTVVSWGYNTFVPVNLTGVVAIVSGDDYNMALKANGTIVAWDNDSNYLSVPSGLKDVVAIAVGFAHRLALKSDGTVVAWGDNNLGEINVPSGLLARQPLAYRYHFDLAPLGLGQVTAQTTTGTATSQMRIPSSPSNILQRNVVPPAILQVSIDPPAAVAAGAKWRRAGTTVWNDSGTSESRVAPGQQVVEFKPIADWAAPTTRTVALASGQLTQTSGTYAYQLGQLGVAIAPPEAANAGAQWRRVGTTAWYNSGTTETRVPIGSQTVEFKDIAITGWARPANTAVTVNPWTTTSLLTRYEAQPLTVTLSTAASDPVVTSITATADFNRLATKFTTAGLALTNARVSGVNWLSPMNTVAGGYYHSLTLRPDGTVAAWGSNTNGQCTVPAGLSGVISVAAGHYHSLALKADGTVAAWGLNTNGQCNVPAGLSGVVSVAAASMHSLTLKADGTVAAWGSNAYGQCNVPAGLSHVVAIATGNGCHSLALKGDGTVVAWGLNDNGQTLVPAGLSGVVAIATGAYFSMALKADGTVVVWGVNSNGQCNVPARLSGVVAISAGYTHCLALKANGTIVAWGGNNYGQCNVPSNVGTAAAISGGLNHTLVQRADGSVLAFGDNSQGQCAVPGGLAARAPAATRYRFTLAPLGTGTFSVQALAGAAQSLGGIPSQASNVLQRNMVLPGGVCVTLQPAAAVAAGAQWRRVGTTLWRNSGTTESGLMPGSAAVEFKPATAWTAPTSQTVTVASGQTAQLQGTYARQTGGLRVTLTPDSAVAAGAQWRRVGTTDWLASGAAESGLPTGSYQVQFKPLDSWITPTTQTVAVTYNATTQASAAYVPTGGLRVTLAPAAAVAAGAQWRRTGTAAWLNSGATEAGLAVGRYQIELKDVAGWTGSARPAVTIGQDQTTSATATYVQQCSSLQVTLAPAAAAAAGAQWRRVGAATWLASGATDSGAPVGTCTVEFKDVANWRKPEKMSAAIVNGQTAKLGAAYTGYLNVSLVSPVLVAAKPGQKADLQASASGTPAITYQWRKNGVAIAGATAGTYSISACRASDEGVYTCLARNDYATTETAGVRLLINNGGGVIAYLLGLSGNASGLDLNKDGKVDISDALQGVWSTPPDVPCAPSPATGVTGMGLKVRLNWADCGWALSYDVYVWEKGTSQPAKPTAGGLTDSQYDLLSGLESQKTYQWQVIARGAQVQTAGPVWTFSTN